MMTTTADRLRDIQGSIAAGEPITDEERELLSMAMITLVQAAHAVDDALGPLVDAFSAFGKSLTDAASRIAAHKPSGHRADGSPYWNYTTLRRPVGKWEEIDPGRIREGQNPGDTPNPQ